MSEAEHRPRRHRHRRRAGHWPRPRLGLRGRRASVVVNDFNVDAAQAVADEIVAAGGKAVANGADVADWEAGAELVATAIREFGGLDTVINNAGFVRDRMLVSLSEDEWDSVVRVHLKGHFVVLRHAAEYWRAQSRPVRSVWRAS